MTKNEKELVLAKLRQELADVSDMCVEEGYPSNGSNYELRAQQIYDWYQEAYPELWED